jgi:hypothetical protein
MKTQYPLAVVRGGLWGQPERHQSMRIPYRLDTNIWGVECVWFRWSPTDNLFDCVMPIGEAIERGFIPAPRVPLSVAACGGVHR